jgi:hypothetical protein
MEGWSGGDGGCRKWKMTEKRKVECVACLWRKGKSGSGPDGRCRNGKRGRRENGDGVCEREKIEALGVAGGWGEKGGLCAGKKEREE